MKSKYFHLIVLFSLSAILAGCPFNSQVREELAAVCQAQDAAAQCKVAEGWQILADATNAVNSALQNDVISVDIAKTYEAQLDHAETALEAAEKLIAIGNETNAMLQAVYGLNLAKEILAKFR